MKLQNLSVIFIIIILPIILVLAYYMTLQADTLNMQAAYNTKLLDSTKEAIDAFEINTVEWNANYSETADSKRRDVMASINTFTNSFANNLGVTGTSREYILANVPAIAFTLYDGYYIYSPAEIKVPAKDSNGVTKFNEDNQILYLTESKTETVNPDEAKTEYKHILKPFTSYSEKVKSGANEVVINYTLDNYITLYGNMKDTDDEFKYVSRGGYLIDTKKLEAGIKNKNIEDVKFDGMDIDPEVLSEKIAYTNEAGEKTTGTFNYVYEAEGNTKVYIEETGGTKKFFRLDSESEKVYVEDLTKPLYKKCTIPKVTGGKTTYIEIYQKLTTDDNKWYKINNSGEYVEFSTDSYTGISNDVKLDYSAINYCVESYVFTKWVNTLGLEATVKLEDGTSTTLAIYIDENNDPENKDSAFSNHKREIIKSVVESNLNQAITSYSRNSSNGDYYLPKLTETDWDQILTNVSIITFVQNIPIGLKYYNNYAIATSTVNKEYVAPSEIYLYEEGFPDNDYYHTPYCDELGISNLIGYRSIDFIQKHYTYKNGENEKTKYYYKHEHDVTQSCYNCLVQRSMYIETKEDAKEIAYYTALARERYVARMSKLPSEIEPSVRIAVEAWDVTDNRLASSTKFKIGDTEVTTGRGSVIVPKNTVSGTRYNIQAQVEGNIIGDEDIADSLGGLGEGERNATSSSVPSQFVTYESSSKATVRVDEYKDDSFRFDVVDIDDIKWGSGNIQNNYDNQIKSFNLEDDVYINVRLNYRKNYTNNGGHIKSVWANINNNNNLTIVTKVKGISKKVRLKFTNTNDINHHIYSEKAFKIPDENEHEIFCEIGNNTNWYTGEWKVEIVATDGTPIASYDKIEYYTIRDAKGLKGFSTAMNEGARSEDRIFKLIEDISGVGTMPPIAGISKDEDGNGWNDVWFDGTFDGTFDGETHTISGVTVDTSSTYNAFGLFGWVGSKAKIKSLNINNIKFQTSSGSRVGGVAGYCDENSEEAYLEAVVVEESEIKGKDYVGGLIGECKGTLSGCKVSDSAITGTSSYAGGIIGYKHTNQDIDENTFTISNISVSGNDNVGGIIGYNKAGSISGITNNTTVNGTGENIGGIVGCNVGGDITECNNNATITGRGKNVGGIVGCNNDKNITKCNNNGSVTGYRNVGGIVGITNQGWISYCGNNNTVRGIGNLLGDGTVLGGAFYKLDEQASGTGGIAGKINNATISHSYNSASITCNFNGGGISGLNVNGTIKYCYNDKVSKITNDGYRRTTNWQGVEIVLNRLGGICGAGVNVTINYCYNTGTIDGETSNMNTSYGSPTGGIIGFLIENSGNNIISYCYNAGNVYGYYTWHSSDLTWYNGAIAGYVGIEPDFSGAKKDTLFVYNYYLEDSSESGGGRNGKKEDGKYQPLSDVNLKKQLYTWAYNGEIPGGVYNEGNYIYCTTAPVETEKGYEGYGILWWQLEGYRRTKFHVYDNAGVPLYPPTLYINGGSKYLDTAQYDCRNYNITTYGYILMLKDGVSYKAKAVAPSYTEGTGREIDVEIGGENDVYVGKRPEFILAINSEDYNGNTIKNNITIPDGNYYIIASGGGGSGPAYPAAYAVWDKNGGGSAGAFIGRVKLEAAQGTKYYCEVGGAGTVYWDNAVNDGHDGLNTVLKQGNREILKVTGGKAGGPNYAGKGGTVSHSLTILNNYLQANGYDGTTDRASSFGAQPVINDISINKLAVGIGKGRGKGGTNYYDEVQDDESGTGGCLYILSDATYCVVKIDVPDNSYNVTVNVSGDAKTQPSDSIINTNISVGTITGNGDQAFIVRKNATVSYTVSREHYNTTTGSFIVGQNLNSNNEQIVKVNLNKKILTHTIASSGANITVRGKFTDNNGNITETSKTGTGSVQFKVWSGDSNVSYTVSKTYYNTKTDSISVTSNGGTTNVTLDKTKYFVKNSNVKYAHSQNLGLYKWRETGRLNSDDGNYDNAYMYGKKNATITISTVTGIPNNWIMYLDGCYAGTSSNTRLTVNINGTQRLSRDNISNDENNNYTITGTGTTVNNIVIRFEGRNAVVARNFYLDSVYFVVND